MEEERVSLESQGNPTESPTEEEFFTAREFYCSSSGRSPLRRLKRKKIKHPPAVAAPPEEPSVNRQKEGETTPGPRAKRLTAKTPDPNSSPGPQRQGRRHPQSEQGRGAETPPTAILTPDRARQSGANRGRGESSSEEQDPAPAKKGNRHRGQPKSLNVLRRLQKATPGSRAKTQRNKNQRKESADRATTPARIQPEPGVGSDSGPANRPKRTRKQLRFLRGHEKDKSEKKAEAPPPRTKKRDRTGSGSNTSGQNPREKEAQPEGRPDPAPTTEARKHHGKGTPEPDSLHRLIIGAITALGEEGGSTAQSILQHILATRIRRERIPPKLLLQEIHQLCQQGTLSRGPNHGYTLAQGTEGNGGALAEDDASSLQEGSAENKCETPLEDKGENFGAGNGTHHGTG